MNTKYKAYLFKVGTKTATFGTRDVKGTMKEVPISNLELTNQARKERGYEEFVHYDGWFPKVYKLLEENGTIFNSEYRKQWFQQNFTLHVEDS